ncbi:MAG: DEAD/DEAH box helicase [Betaproteobacteria bacterium]
MPDLAVAKRALQEHFDRRDLDRGYAYATGGRAHIVAERGERGHYEIEALCRGSRPQPYRLTVRLDLDESGQVEFAEGDCSCPMEVDCKHVASAALTWLARQPDDPGLSTAARTASPGPQAIQLPGEAEEWLKGIAHAFVPQRAQPKGECVCYRLHADACVIETERARILKDGRLTGVRRCWPELGWLAADREPPRYLTQPDLAAMRALARLSQARGGSYGWKLEAEAGADALQAALATGRLALAADSRNPGAELRLDGAGWLRPGEPIHATLVLRREGARTRWVAVPKNDPQRALVAIATSPPAYLDAARGEIGALQLDGPQPALNQLLRMPPMTEDQARLALAAVRSAAEEAGAAHIVALLPSDIQACAPPRPRLRFTHGLFRNWGGNGKPERHWLAELWFDYPHGIAVPAQDAAAAGLRVVDVEGNQRLVLRDLKMERSVRQKLVRAGCGIQPSYGMPQRVDAQRLYALLGKESPAGWRERAESFFEAAYAAGAAIECDDDFPHRLRDADETYEELREGAPGWFDLELGVVLEGRRISLAGAIVDWLRRVSDPQRWLAGDGGDAVLLKVPELGLIRFPAARLRALLAPLFDGYSLERPAAGGALRLTRLEAALLPAAPSFPAGLARLRERLAGFAGVAHATAPRSFRAALRPYQQVGLDWLQFLREHELAGILADDMGLGKTVQALAHLELEKDAGRADRPSLVVAPTSVLPNWRDEAARFAPQLRVLLLHGPQRTADRGRIEDSDLVLTSYALLARDRAVLEAVDWHLAVFDEAQFLKNYKTQAHAAAAALRARHRVALTGTPIENNLGELWAHFNLLLPGFLGDATQFARTWRTPIEKESDTGRLAVLARRVRPFVLRRTRAQVLAELPPKSEIVQRVELDGAQRDLYESLRIALDRSVRQAIAEKGIAGSQIHILDALLKLRQACCDPRLVKSARAKAAHGASAKLQALREMLAELKAEGRRALLFSQFTSMLDLIEPELPALGMKHVRISGETRDRDTPVKAFQNGDADLFLISLRAGGTGLNLTAADTVIHYDPWWNPAVESQATARAHRIGQDKAIFVFKLIAAGTVEERMLSLVERKQALADALLGEGRARGPVISEDDVRALLAPLDAGARGQSSSRR